jgi:hypothetical protein
MALPELTIIKSSLTRNNYSTVSSYISVEDFPQELQLLWRCLDNFYRDSSNNELTIDDLSNLVFSSRPKDRDFVIALFDNLKTIEVSKDSVVALCKALQESKLLRAVALTAYDAAEGKEKEKERLSELLEQLRKLQEDSHGAPDDEYEFVTDDLDTLLDRQVSTPGLRWRLNSLNRNLGSLRKGNFGFIFARPETGKTTLLTSEVSHMAEQVKDDDGPILHLNNEQEGDIVQLYYYRSVLGWSLEQILANRKKARDMFMEKTRGKILVYDRAQISKRDVEKLCERYKPSLLIYDQIDKITGFSNDREDLRLGAIYQWGRELAKTYCPSIGVCQADGTGEGQRWLTMGNVANAKTSKQAEADWILGIGKVNDPGYEKLRFMHLSKNKLLGDPDTDHSNRHGRWEVLIEPEKARYRDL